MYTMERFTLAHGSGGVETQEIIENIIRPKAKLWKVPDGIGLDELDDGSTIPLKIGGEERHLVVSTDVYTVKPIFFPGGDIGKLAAAGSINDVAVMGAKPIAVMDSIVVEEGFSIDDFEKIMTSFTRVLEKESVALIGGDFKVMPKGSVDGIVISTTGIGIANKLLKDSNLRPGYSIVVSGYVGDHGATIMACQLGLGVSGELKSDVATLTKVMDIALKYNVVAAKDPTRGGLAMALNEMARKSGTSIIVYEDKIPIRESVKAYGEMMGIDPLVLASEGVAVLCVSSEDAKDLVEELRNNGYKHAEIIGEVRREPIGKVFLKTVVGGVRVIERPFGEIVPRIC